MLKSALFDAKLPSPHIGTSSSTTFLIRVNVVAVWCSSSDGFEYHKRPAKLRMLCGFFCICRSHTFDVWSAIRSRRACYSRGSWTVMSCNGLELENVDKNCIPCVFSRCLFLWIQSVYFFIMRCIVLFLLWFFGCAVSFYCGVFHTHRQNGKSSLSLGAFKFTFYKVFGLFLGGLVRLL